MTEQQKSYEQARDELVEIVRKLESGGVPLAQAMALWEEGERLATTCQQWLDGAKATIAQARSSTRSSNDTVTSDLAADDR